MDSNNNNNNNSSGSSDGDIGCHFLPTSTTSPHFFDLPPFHLDSPFSFPHLLSSPPTSATTSAQRVTTEPINTTPAPAPLTSPVGPTRPSKKRSRASRRAPTTVLTTDTSNFRAMVQEFTGIPAPPFSSTSASTSLHFPRSFSLNPPPSFLLKPFPHKFQSTTTTTSTPEFDFRRNPNSTAINFQSLLQSQLVNLPQPPAPNMSSNSGGLDLPGIIGPGSSGEACKLNFSAPGPISSTATAEFHVDKGGHGSTTDGGREGLMESWICSSD